MPHSPFDIIDSQFYYILNCIPGYNPWFTPPDCILVGRPSPVPSESWVASSAAEEYATNLTFPVLMAHRRWLRSHIHLADSILSCLICCQELGIRFNNMILSICIRLNPIHFRTLGPILIENLLLRLLHEGFSPVVHLIRSLLLNRGIVGRTCLNPVTMSMADVGMWGQLSETERVRAGGVGIWRPCSTRRYRIGPSPPVALAARYPET